MYVEDALGHESIMKNCACKTSNDLKDVSLSSYIKELDIEIENETNNKTTFVLPKELRRA